MALATLNREFPVSRHGRFLTIWYGVLDLDATALTFSTAGHPPAVLIRREGEPRLLSTNGIVTGCKEGATYENMLCPLRTGDTLFIAMVLTNWATSRGQTVSFSDLAALFERATHGANPLDEILTELKRRGESERFADDVSLLAIKIH